MAAWCPSVRHQRGRRRPWTVWLLLLLGLPAWGADLERGEEINGVCAGCHGDQGQGGKGGEYPRLAGQSARYLKDQLKAFRSRTRVNIPMFPYTQERELPDADIEDVAEYLASLRAPGSPPTAMNKEADTPRADGDRDKGAAIYREECAYCHRGNGSGAGEFPMLAGQYTNYLRKQIAAYRRKERPHDGEEPGGVLDTLSEEDIRNALAYLTTLGGGAGAK